MHHGIISTEIAEGLRVLRERIDDADIPSSSLDETLNLATWNIREFGKTPREEAAVHLIAEIIGQFDVVAVTEVRDNVADLERVLRILGPYWRVVFSDFNSDRAGNRERIAFVYDKRAVAFTGLASEADAARKKMKVIVDGQEVWEYRSLITWWRSPYMASFRAGDFDFILIAAHIRWDSKGGEKSRIRALKLLANWLDKRRKDEDVIDQDIIVMGDFNIPAVGDDLYEAITSKGLRMPASLLGAPGSNLAQNKRYDQILHYPSYTNSFTDEGGVLDFYQDDHQSLFPGITMTKERFTYQLSDHLPIWVQLDTDTDDERLDQILNPER